MTTRDIEHQGGWLESQLADPEFRVEFDKERAASEFVDQLDSALRLKGITRSAFASRIGRSRAYVTQTLRRQANLTIKTMVELAAACGYELHLTLLPASANGGPVWVDPGEGWNVVRPAVRPLARCNAEFEIDDESSVALGSDELAPSRETDDLWKLLPVESMACGGER
jgi:transcriptional regulator with XRE-family HTH domain